MRVQLSPAAVGVFGLVVALAGCASPEPAPRTRRPLSFPLIVAPNPFVLRPLTLGEERELAAEQEEIAAREREWPEPGVGPIIIKGGFEPRPETPEEQAVRLKVERLTRAAKATEGQDNGTPPPRPSVNCSDVKELPHAPAPTGPHIRCLANPEQPVGIFAAPGVQMMWQLDQGAPCEILTSERHAGTVWFLVRSRGVQGWTPLVDAY